MGIKELSDHGHILRSRLLLTPDQYQRFQEVWFHGNLLEELPEQIGQLKNLERLSLSGNRCPASTHKPQKMAESHRIP